MSELLISLGVDPASAMPDVASESAQEMNGLDPGDSQGMGLVRTRSAQERLRREAAEVELRAAELEEEAMKAELATVEAELATVCGGSYPQLRSRQLYT
eukprot:COSAG02_NODE_5642_length_4160_cov_2.781335_3_plen_99_part_00